MNFRQALENNDFSAAQKFIHSDGVFFFGHGRINKSDFNMSAIKSSFDYLMLKGKVVIGDNYSNAAGWDGYMKSPHVSFDGWIERNGFFLEGSKIVSVDPNPEENYERLLIELYPDKGHWRVYSIGQWLWSP